MSSRAGFVITIAEGPMNWRDHILERANGDEAEAFRLFFEHFNEYVNERGKIGPEGIKALCARTRPRHGRP